jgi:hypothetical protein
MYHIYEIDMDGRGDNVWDVYEDDHSPFPAPANYRESFESYNDLVTFLDNCKAEGVEFTVHTLADWDDNA